jgi:FkbM family methyltransferase
MHETDSVFQFSSATSNANTQSHHFYGQFDPPVDQFLYSRYFMDRSEPGVFIECGAFDGFLESSCRFFEETFGWRGINVEASSTIYKRLQMNRPNSENFNYGLTNFEGEIEFVDVEMPSYELCTNGSIRHLDSHKELLDSASCVYRKSIVPAITYAKLIQLIGIDKLDLMVLDVEGHEIEAIQGFHGASVLPKVLCIEHGHLGVGTLQDALRPFGYRLDTTLFVNSYYLLEGV